MHPSGLQEIRQTKGQRVSDIADLEPTYPLPLRDEVSNASTPMRLDVRLEAVRALSQTLVLTHDVSLIASQVVDAAERVMPCGACAVWIVDDGRRHVVRRAASARVAAIDRAPLVLEEGRACLVLAAMRAGEIIYVPDTNLDSRDVDVGPEHRSAMCLPLRVETQTIGVLEVGSSRPNAFDTSARWLLGTLADQASLAIENARLFAELEHLKNFHENLVNNMAEGMTVQDAEGRVTFINPSAAAIFGRRPEEVIGQRVVDLLPASQQSAIVHAMARRQAGKSDQYELEVVRPDGTRLPVLVAGRPLYEGETFAGTVAVFTDLTEVKQLQTQLIQAARLSATGQLAASLAHEINNPLQAIHNGLQILLTFPTEPEEQREYLEVTAHEVERLIEMVGRILDFSRRPKLEMEELAINDVVGTVLLLASKYLQHRRVALEQNLAPDLPPVWAASDALKQVFLNLLINATEAMRGGGELRVTSGWNGHDWVDVSFADTGVGIPAGDLDQVFQPFYTTKDRSSGLGLAVSYNIVRQHGGWILIESEVGVGTTATVRLPALGRTDIGL